MRFFAFAAPLLSVVGCTPSTATSSPPTTTDAATATSEADARPDEHGIPEPVRVDVLGKICGVAACSGKLARIRVYYTPKGRIHRYAHDGDITACSHPPTTVYDPDGKEVGGIPLEPIQPGSPRAKEIDALHTKLFGDAKHLATYDCAGKALTK